MTEKYTVVDLEYSQYAMRCNKCGAAVVDRQRHTEWHEYLDYWFGEFSGENKQKRLEAKAEDEAMRRAEDAMVRETENRQDRYLRDESDTYGNE